MPNWKSKKDGKHFKIDKKKRSVDSNESPDVDPNELDNFAEEKIHELLDDDVEQYKQVEIIGDDGEPLPVDHEVHVYQYDIEIPEGQDEYEIVDKFLKQNNLFDVIKVRNDSSKPEKFDNEFSFRLEKGFKAAGMSGYPGGSGYLSTDGEWFGGEGVYGYDEDHRPQIAKALTYAAMELDGKGDENGELSRSEVMINALHKSGIIRMGVRGDSLNVDIYQPMTSSQIKELKNLVIEGHLKPDDIVIDVNNVKGLTEDKVLRAIGANEDYEDDY